MHNHCGFGFQVNPITKVAYYLVLDGSILINKDVVEVKFTTCYTTRQAPEVVVIVGSGTTLILWEHNSVVGALAQNAEWDVDVVPLVVVANVAQQFVDT